MRKSSNGKFKLEDSFVGRYSERTPPFGYNGVGNVAFMRTYSRLNENGSNENWGQTVQRVIEGTYRLQKFHVERAGKKWDEHQGQISAQEMFDRMYNLKFTPPGRGLWAMGSPITEDKKLYAALNNCAFVSTKNIDQDLEKPFTFLMDASMVGVGVGFDTRGAGKIRIKEPDSERRCEFYDIADTRESWVKSLGILLRSYFLGDPEVHFGYDKIRPEGEPIKTFGGRASGPEPLKELHRDLKELLDSRIGSPINERDIVDIQNLIGRAVVAGNVRRTAEVAFGDPNSEQFLDLKNYKLYPERKGWGWASNNSIFAEIGMDYKDVAERIRDNGEPGVVWLENMRRFGRMGDPPNNLDEKAEGANPCIEQTLESYEMCCLVENYPGRHSSLDDFLRTLKFSYLYAKTVTLGETQWPETNEVLMRNRRIGCSMSGISQFISERGFHELTRWSEAGYKEIQEWDSKYSNWLAIPRSIKTTSIKPSGTVSLLAGVPPGIHFPHSEHYIRRMRISKNSELLKPIEEAGYVIEQDKNDSSSMVIEFPIHEGGGIRSKDQVSMWEQLNIAAHMQKVWSDNQVSATITFDPEREGHQISHALEQYQDKLKGVSFLPLRDHGYEQAPYESISAEEYSSRSKGLKTLDFSKIEGEEAEIERFCDGDKCKIPLQED